MDVLRALFDDLRRATPRIQILAFGAAGCSAFLLLVGLSALSSGSLEGFFLLLLAAAMVLGLMVVVLRTSGAADRALDAALASGATPPDPHEPPRSIGMIAYRHDGWVYGLASRFPSGVLTVAPDSIVFEASSRNRAMAAVLGESDHFRFEFGRATITRVLAPKGGQDLIVMAPNGPHRFMVGASSWIPVIEALARHRYPLARDTSLEI